ncbi:MAG: UbiD family decarboxylase, partial [Deltaproteobacteria bacterium]|nr:UbiD family decarboxylase [Deltaproteobacteria bacterium]
MGEKNKNHPRDLRGWLELLKEKDDLRVVDEKVTPDGEIQEIGRQMSLREGQAVLFTNIEGHEDTWCSKLSIGSLNTFGKLAMAMGLPRDSAKPDMVARLRETLRNYVQPEIVETSPMKKNVIKEGIDIGKLPVPRWHPKSERYINSWFGAVTKDPDTGDYNMSCYGGHIVDENTIASFFARQKDWGLHFTKYCDRGEDMPVAFCYGLDPAYMIPAAVSWGHGGRKWGEFEWIGSIMGEPVPLIKCETIDLYVPAMAEIVFEGHMLCDSATYVQHGITKDKDFGKAYTDSKISPAVKIDCITHRDDPIYTGSAFGFASVGG